MAYLRFKRNWEGSIYNVARGQLIEVVDEQLAAELIRDGVAENVTRENAVAEFTGVERAVEPDSSQLKQAARPGANRGTSTNR